MFSMNPNEAEKAKNPAKLPIVISLFNHKGGVGKTTATYEIGYVLYTMGLKVLMIDADPQSSLTALINPELSSDSVKAQEFNAALQAKKENNNRYVRIDDIFEPALRLANEDTVPIERAEQVDPLLVHKYGKPDCRSQKQGLYYLPGSIKLDRLNKLIALAINKVPGMSRFANMVPSLIREIGRINQFDIILIDLNPGIHQLNQSIIMKSDYLLMPFKPSIGCLDAVKNLTEVFPGWFKELRDAELLGPDEGPLLLGTFPQIIRTRKQMHKDVKYVESAYAIWIKEIFSKTNELLQVFMKNMPGQQVTIPFKDMQDRIGIRDFIGAGLQVQNSGHPMSDTSYQHTQVDKRGHKEMFRKEWDDLKRETLNSYQKILGRVFESLKEGHKKLLTEKNKNIINTLKLYSILHETIKSDTEAKLPTPRIAAPKIATPKKVGGRRPGLDKIGLEWYNDDDITTLIKHYLAGRERNFAFITPLQGDGRFSESQLAEEIKANILLKIGNDEVPEEGMTIFIPLNLGARSSSATEGGNHWTLAFINVSPGRAEIFYFDPLGDNAPQSVDKALKTVVNDVYETEIHNIGRLQETIRVQYDGHNCGPWIVAFICQLIKNGDAAWRPDELLKTNIDQQRQEFYKIIESAKASNQRKRSSSTPSKEPKRRPTASDNDDQDQDSALAGIDESAKAPSQRRRSSSTPSKESKRRPTASDNDDQDQSSAVSLSSASAAFLPTTSSGSVLPVVGMFKASAVSRSPRTPSGASSSSVSMASNVLTDEEIAHNIALTRSEEDAKVKSSLRQRRS